MTRVAVIFTGGTISMVASADAGGRVPTLDGAAILARAPGIDRIAEVVPIDLGRTPASHFSFEKLFEIASEIRRCQADPALDGVVVVQGTDVIEETAFFWDLVLDGETPVVVTGAMRAASDANDDGPDNLRDAVRCAASPALRGQGVAVVLDHTINQADDVTKTHASALDTFQCLNVGPLGTVEGEEIVLTRSRGARRHVTTDRAASGVQVVTAHVAMDGSQLDGAAAKGAPGIVVAATGAGNTSPLLLEAAERAMGQGIAVALTTRVAAGAAGDGYAFPGGGATWVRAGALLAGHLSAPKARIALALGLGAGLDHAALGRLLADPPGFGPVVDSAPRPVAELASPPPPGAAPDTPPSAPGVPPRRC
ncbi:MAG TPA: asparaginase [Candidatus Limnocylindrales bacterium]|nr:asparaginase [Candidatus Limnocylindrales bacterium]